MTFPRDTEIILGHGRFGVDEPGCLGVTICRGTRFRFHAPSKLDQDSGKLVRLFRDGRLLYRLPTRELVGIGVPLTGRGSISMKLLVDLSQVPETVRGGKVSLIQSQADGAVMGGVDVIVRP